MATRALRLRETQHITGYCDMQLRRMEHAGTFPKRFKLNPNGGPFGAVAHDYDEVMAWHKERVTAGKAQAEAASAEAKELYANRGARRGGHADV